MKKEFLLLISFLLSFSFLYSQNEIKFCGSTDVYNKILKEHPEYINEINLSNQQLENYTKEYIANDINNSKRGEIVYTIPVVFHIIHNYGLENISNEQIYDAMRILNEDFNKLNTDTSDVVSQFKNIIGNPNIKFKLAQKDPMGNCTNGITRDVSLETYKGNNLFGNTSTSDINRWPRNKYLNIWVVSSIEQGSAGYTYTPGTVNNSSKLDGIILNHTYIGSIGSGDPRKSRALTHEVGHWINLKHTWGGTNDPGCDGKSTVTTDPCYGKDNCNSDDDVSDTPNTIGYITCNLSATSCGALSNVQNFMEYSYCSNMFTQGQASRMRASLTASTAQRNSLWSASNLIATGTNDNYNSLCFVDFSADKNIVCVGQNITFKDLSYNGSNIWEWNFPGANTTSSNSQNPIINYQNPGLYDVKLTVGNGIESKFTEKKAYINVLPAKGAALPFSESFEVSNDFSKNWTIQNLDNGVTWQSNNYAAYSGSSSLKINNFSNDSGKTDLLISNNIDLSGRKTVNISFKVAFAQKKTGNNDILKVYASNDCGQTWLLRLIKSGNLLSGGIFQDTEFTPASNQWQELKITNITTAYMVSNFRLKFEFTSGNGNNFYIDDINIIDPSATSTDDINSIENFNVYPNPFEEEIMIDFELKNAQKLTISILDLLGREIIITDNEYRKKGEQRLKLSKTGLGIEKGIYFLYIKSFNNKISKKIIVN